LLWSPDHRYSLLYVYFRLLQGEFNRVRIVRKLTHTVALQPQTGDTAQLFNFGRQTFGFTLGFFSLPLGHKIGFQFSFLIYALISLVLLLPMAWLMRYGLATRQRLGKPAFDRSL
jgi:hypothetical protein